MSKPVTEAAKAVTLAAQMVDKQWRAVSHIMHKEADQLAAQALSEQVRYLILKEARSAKQISPEIPMQISVT